MTRNTTNGNSNRRRRVEVLFYYISIVVLLYNLIFICVVDIGFTIVNGTNDNHNNGKLWEILTTTTFKANATRDIKGVRKGLTKLGRNQVILDYTWEDKKNNKKEPKKDDVVVTPKAAENNDDPLTTGLWKGDIPDGTGIPDRFDRIFIVISHCKNDLSWLNNFTHSDVDNIATTIMPNITIISKCNTPVTGAPPKSTIITLPNVGRCDHSYAWWMSQMTSSSSLSPNDLIVFLKDTRKIHQTGGYRTMTDMMTIASVDEFACGIRPGEIRKNNFGDMSVYHLTERVLTFKIFVYVEKKGDGMDLFKTNYSDLGDWLRHVIVPEGGDKSQQKQLLPTPFTSVCYGGHFATTGASIIKHGTEMWHRMAQSLDRGDNLAEGHFAERSWAGLLTRSLKEEEVTTLEHYKTRYMWSHPAYRGCMVHS